MTSLALAIATVLGVGRVPFAPGTFGSAVGLLVWAALWALSGSVALQAAAIVVVFVAGVWSASVAERRYGATDPGAVVIDEVLGMLITLFLNPVGWRGALVGFVLFRIFDVIKPYPANRLERLHGGLGIMADDAMAAVYANMVLRVLVALAPPGLL
jgi:phosphatidylglycerophosphatase A